jgi:hypothetical protein
MYSKRLWNINYQLTLKRSYVMKPAFRKIIVMIVVSLWILPAGVLVGSSQVFAGPLEVTINGTFVEGKAKRDLKVYMLTVHDKKTMLKHLFKVTDIASNVGDPWEILNEVFPPMMTIIGDEKDTKIFRQDDIVGKSYMIRGTLYIDERILHVVSVKEAAEKK